MNGQLELINEPRPVPRVPLCPPLLAPAEGFACVVCDPPWPFDSKLREPLPYRTMTTEELEAFSTNVLRPILAPAAHLWIWAVDAHLELACRMLRLAGTTLVCHVPWVKTLSGRAAVLQRFDIPIPEWEVPPVRIGGGSYLRHASELCLLGVKGPAVPTDKGASNVLFAPRTAHSVKPDTLQHLAERIAPNGGRAELFARRSLPGWYCWGDDPALTEGDR